MDEVIASKSFVNTIVFWSFVVKQAHYLRNDDRIAAMPRSYFHPPGAQQVPSNV